MAVINNYNNNRLDIKLSNADYWDFVLARGNMLGGGAQNCVASWFDFNEPSIFTNTNLIASLTTWTGATSSGYTFDTIGLTGLDNGLITFEKLESDTDNIALLNALTGSTLIIPSGETRLFLNAVTGTTGEYVYPMSLTPDTTSVGDYLKLCGGFYQGYYKIDGSTYQVLPTRVNKAWVAEFWLKKESNICADITGTTLNDIYPENKGLFFYMGTRAENKFWNIFSGNTTGDCSTSTTNWCTQPKETDISIIGEYNTAIPLSPPAIEIDLVTNPFLIYGRARPNKGSCGSCGGEHDGLGQYDVCTYKGGGIVVTNYATHITNITNPFLIYGRAKPNNSGCGTCGGEHDGYGQHTVCSFSGFTSLSNELDIKKDITDNALGFMIKDDGSIGYRLLTITGTCASAYTIQESFSLSGVVKDDIWTNVVIRFVTNYLDDCDLTIKPKRKGNLMFYIDGHLKHIARDVDEFVARRLSEFKGKQVGVPFNISLGGGSQGLIDSQTFDGVDADDRGLPIETNFAGTFIGSISQFKLNTCDISFPDILRNYKLQMGRYYPVNNT